MKHFLSSSMIGGLILVTLGPAALAADKVLDAYAAGRDGVVSIHAVSTQGYHELKVEIENLTKNPVTLDFHSTAFVPVSGEEQRIGVTLVKSDGAKTVPVAANSKKTVTFVSRCLDSSRPSPATGEKFLMAAEPLPAGIAELLRRNASQDRVWQETDGPKSATWKQMDPRLKPKSEADRPSESSGAP